jgi:hypothetical protein
MYDFFFVTMSATCRQMSCRFDTLADMKIGRVGDMTDGHVADTTHVSADQDVKQHDTKRHTTLRRVEVARRGFKTRLVGMGFFFR